MTTQHETQALAAPSYIFAYGTLMQGYGNNSVLQGSRSLGRAHTQEPNFEMFHAGVPFVRFAVGVGGVRIAGEVFEVSPAVLAAADRLEGHPDWYKRTPIACTLDATGAAVQAFIYLNSAVGDSGGEGVLIDDAARIASGDFRDVVPPPPQEARPACAGGGGFS